MRKIRLVIAEGRTLFRQALAALLCAEPDFEIVGEAATDDEIRRLCSRLQPDSVLLDAGLPCALGYDALALLTGLRAVSPETAVVVLGEAGSGAVPGLPLSERAARTAAEAERKRAQNLGAFACLRPTVDGNELIRTLRAAVACSGNAAEHAPHETVPHHLTEREAEILALIAQGLCNKEIAQRLNIHTQTVKNHVSHLLEKLALADRLQLAVYALEQPPKT